MGASSEILPRYMVLSQLKILTPEGIATRNVSAENTTVASWLWPATNMWWPHTMKLTSASDTLEYAMARYPKIVLWEKVGISSLMIAMPGRIIIYTAGCE